MGCICDGEGYVIIKMLEIASTSENISKAIDEVLGPINLRSHTHELAKKAAKQCRRKQIN